VIGTKIKSRSDLFLTISGNIEEESSTDGGYYVRTKRIMVAKADAGISEPVMPPRRQTPGPTDVTRGKRRKAKNDTGGLYFLRPQANMKIFVTQDDNHKLAIIIMI
jgi:hypothetical protein